MVCAGPPSNASQVLAMFDHVRQQWPGATVQASTLDAYLEGLTQALAAGGLTLPVVTGVLTHKLRFCLCCIVSCGVHTTRACLKQERGPASQTVPSNVLWESVEGSDVKCEVCPLVQDGSCRASIGRVYRYCSHQPCWSPTGSTWPPGARLNDDVLAYYSSSTAGKGWGCCKCVC